MFYWVYKYRKETVDMSKTCWSSDSMAINIGYTTFQNAHVDCKKDNSDVLCNTTTPKISNDINKLLSSRFIAILISGNQQQQSYVTLFISKHSRDIQVHSPEDNVGSIKLHYKIADPVADLLVSMEEPLCEAG